MTGNYAEYYILMLMHICQKNEHRSNAKAIDSDGTGLKEMSTSLEAALRDSWTDVIVIKMRLQTCPLRPGKDGQGQQVVCCHTWVMEKASSDIDSNVRTSNSILIEEVLLQLHGLTSMPVPRTPAPKHHDINQKKSWPLTKHQKPIYPYPLGSNVPCLHTFTTTRQHKPKNHITSCVPFPSRHLLPPSLPRQTLQHLQKQPAHQ
ncbi:hypothetical protein J3459_012064 [Metarhizium acridum]|nr:hypothetical protein J3459_012064 [Metarhizium acridum]